MSIFDQGPEWVAELMKEFASQSDRAAVIVGATMLDELLRDVISVFLIEDTKKADNLFGNNMPLGTFSSRIEMAYCLGLIGEQEYRNLKTIKSIRNDFAHRLIGTSFSESPIKDKCSNIKLPKEIYPDELPPRDLFRNAVMYSGTLLILRSLQAEKRRCSVPDEIPPVTDFEAAFVEYSRDKSTEDKIPPLDEILRSLED
jgi:DNA-binding MltR family transcriptional regulator